MTAIEKILSLLVLLLLNVGTHTSLRSLVSISESNGLSPRSGRLPKQNERGDSNNTTRKHGRSPHDRLEASQQMKKITRHLRTIHVRDRSAPSEAFVRVDKHCSAWVKPLIAGVGRSRKRGGAMRTEEPATPATKHNNLDNVQRHAAKRPSS